MLKKVIKDVFDANLKKQLDNIDTNENVMNYVNLLSSLDESLCSIARTSLKTIFESLDHSSKISRERKSKYDIKSSHERTILTVFGEITYKRTFYTSKVNSKNYCYVDRLLGLHKYDYFDPYIKALIIEYSANNSMPKTATIVNDLIGNRISIDAKFKLISRQTVRNIIMNSKISEVKVQRIENEVEELYIIADEKWIHTQNNNHQDVMEKSIVIFEGIEEHALQNKMIFSSLDKTFLDDALNYVVDKYDPDLIKRIYLMGDGASWIKNLRHELRFREGLEVIYGLDKFHFKQALHHLCFHEELEIIARSYVLSDNKKAFNELCETLIKEHFHRKDTIEEKQKYIINNWSFINNMYKYKLSCPMESQISHNLADFFTSRPKGFAIDTIKKLTTLRMLFKNNFSIKKLFLNNFNSSDILTINKEHFNFDIFERKSSSLNFFIKDPIYPIPYDNSYHPSH